MNFSTIISQLNSIGNFFGRFRQALSVTRESQLFANYPTKGSPIIVDADNLLAVYNSCPALPTIIGRGAEMFSNGDFKVVDKEGKEIENHPLTLFFRQPNPLEKLEEWLYTYFVLRSIFGKTFIYKNQPSLLALPKVIWHLNPQFIKIIPTGKLLDQYELNGIISHYLLCENGYEKKLLTEEVIFQKHGVGNNPLNPESKLISLLLPISNIIGAFKALNIASYHGAKVILSSEAGNGAIGLSKDEREKMEKEYGSGYGLADNQSTTIITNATLKASIISFPTKDLLFLEQNIANFNEICFAYGIDKNIFDNSTYENKQKGERATYQNTIIPVADELVNIITQNFFSFLKAGEKVVIDYSYLPLMQAEKPKISDLSIALHDGVIDHQQYADVAGLKLTGDSKIIQRNNNNGIGGGGN